MHDPSVCFVSGAAILLGRGARSLSGRERDRLGGHLDTLLLPLEPGNEERRDRAAREHRGADRQRRDEAVGERLRARVGAAGRERAASTATPITPPSSRIAFVAPEAWPASSGRAERSTAFALGANTSAMPVPPMASGRISDA